MVAYENYDAGDIPEKLKKEMNSENKNIGEQIDRLEKEDPNVTVLSWTNEYATIWYWITMNYKTYGLFPPSLKIDRRHAPKGKNKGTAYDVMTVASINAMWRWFELMDGNFNNVFPSYYELRVYHDNFMRSIREYKNAIHPEVIQMEMQHILMHELMHHLEYSKFYNKIHKALEKDDYEKYTKACNALHDKTMKIMNMTGKVEEERENEKDTLQALTEFWLRGYPRPKIGGLYDTFMRSRNDDYRMCSIMIEKLGRDWAHDFLDLTDEERKRNSMEYALRVGDLRKMSKQLPKEQRKVIIID